MCLIWRGRTDEATGIASYPDAPVALCRLIEVASLNHIVGQLPPPGDDLKEGDNKRILTELIENAYQRADRDHMRNSFEADRLIRSLSATGLKPIVLKGAAYQMLEQAAGKGRRSSDIDILVDRADLDTVERALRDSGFIDHGATNNPYAQHYYRQYMHELPPLIHSVRRTLIDVHHALSPRTARVQEDTTALIAGAVPLESPLMSKQALLVLAPIDQFLHAALHSLYDGDFTHPVRHMLDMAYLFRAMDKKDRDGLMGRAEELGLHKPAALALRLLNKLDLLPEGTMVPASPALVTESVMMAAIKNGDAAGLVGFYLYCRGHLLRMPLVMLTRHLAKKLWSRFRPSSQGPEADRQTIEEHLR